MLLHKRIDLAVFWNLLNSTLLHNHRKLVLQVEGERASVCRRCVVTSC
jgi:hypothetical protein